MKVESGVNIRKPNTITSSNTLSKYYIWKQLSPHLHQKEENLSQTRFI